MQYLVIDDVLFSLWFNIWVIQEQFVVPVSIDRNKSLHTGSLTYLVFNFIYFTFLLGICAFISTPNFIRTSWELDLVYLTV